MQRFPILDFLDITQEERFGLLEIVLTTNIINSSHGMNVGGKSGENGDQNFAQQLIDINPVSIIPKQAPLAVKANSYTISQLYGLTFAKDDIAQNAFVNLSSKQTLIKRINNSILISSQDRNRWTDYLMTDLDYAQIKKVQEEFEQAEQKNNTDSIVKKLIISACNYLTKNFLNGSRQVGTLTLPDMTGMQEDFIKFYMSSQVQDFFIQSPLGTKIRQSSNNPFVQLTFDLVIRCIQNNISI